MFTHDVIGEHGTADAVTGKDLNYIFSKTPEEILDNDFYKFKLGQFILT
jgi:hypothetical protein